MSDQLLKMFAKNFFSSVETDCEPKSINGSFHRCQNFFSSLPHKSLLPKLCQFLRVQFILQFTCTSVNTCIGRVIDAMSLPKSVQKVHLCDNLKVRKVHRMTTVVVLTETKLLFLPKTVLRKRSSKIIYCK